MVTGEAVTGRTVGSHAVAGQGAAGREAVAGHEAPGGQQSAGGEEAVAGRVRTGGAASPGLPARDGAAVPARPPGARTIDEVLAAARAGLRRVTPRQAFAEFSRGAVLVDIRPQAQRAREGGIPGAVIVERNVLEWRFDPASDARLPWVDGYGQRVIVFCSEGYTSSLAASALTELGLAGATDMIGGFVAWRAGGLPICPPTPVTGPG